MRSVFAPDTLIAPSFAMDHSGPPEEVSLETGQLTKDVSAMSTPAMDPPGSPGMESLEVGQLASCQEVTKAAMPSMTSPTSLGGAALESGKHEEMG